MTDAERHARASALLIEALARPAAARDGWLDGACDDPAVRARVRALLDAHAADGLLDAPALRRNADPLIGSIVGPWRVDGLLGHGGMGSVYAVDRADASFRQPAALKRLRPGLGPGSRARFVRERAVLAALEHPGIARLLDGGVAPDGTPYLVTERVDGEPLPAYADARGLGARERVALFVQACDAVAYAHRALVVHRDLKPAHVLVTDSEGRPHVKVLDFGIAKLLDGADDGLTRTGSAPMTPAYAAPEQVLGGPVTTATDVYALGVVLYELLAGRRPYDLAGRTAADVERVVATAEPPAPSAVSAAPGLRGDLDAVVLKALAKEPERRYASAEALADDLRRHLDGVPVRARPATAGYRAARFVRRHRAGVAAAAAVVVGVAALAALHTARLGAERDRARQAAAEAVAEAERAEAVAGFLEDILRAPNTRWYAAGGGPDTPVRAVLDAAAARVDAEFSDRPALRADLHHVLGDTYLSLGLADAGRRHHRAVLAVRESLYAAPHPGIAEALYYLSSVLGDDAWAENVALLERAVAMQRAVAAEGRYDEGNNFPFMAQELAHRYLYGGRPVAASALIAESQADVEARFVPGSEGGRYRDAALLAGARLWAAARLAVGDRGGAARHLRTADSLLARLPRTAAYRPSWAALGCIRGDLHRARGELREAERQYRTCLGEPPPRGLAGPYPVPERPGEIGVLQASGAAALVDLLEGQGRGAETAPYRDAAADHRAMREALRRALTPADGLPPTRPVAAPTPAKP